LGVRAISFAGGRLGDLAGALGPDSQPIAALRVACSLPTSAEERLGVPARYPNEGEAKMRVFSIALIALISLTQAQAEEPNQSKKSSNGCSYTIHGYLYGVPNGTSLCWRSPFPYTTVYGLLHCDPPLQEITLVKRSDPRCGGHYEERQ
jgi:hypothetical protein